MATIIEFSSYTKPNYLSDEEVNCVVIDSADLPNRAFGKLEPGNTPTIKTNLTLDGKSVLIEFDEAVGLIGVNDAVKVYRDGVDITEKLANLIDAGYQMREATDCLNESLFCLDSVASDSVEPGIAESLIKAQKTLRALRSQISNTVATMMEVTP